MFTFPILSKEREGEEVLRGPKQQMYSIHNILTLTGVSFGDVSKKLQNPTHSLSLLT